MVNAAEAAAKTSLEDPLESRQELILEDPRKSMEAVVLEAQPLSQDKLGQDPDLELI